MRTEYREQDRRERLLRGIYEWDQNRTNFRDPLGADQIVDIGGEERALNTFLTLVREQYIDADPPIGGAKPPAPAFDMVFVRGLHEKGLRSIGELPDSQESFVAGLEAAIRAIRGDESIPNPERERRAAVFEEAKQIGRPLAVDIIKAIFKGDIPFM